MAPGLAAAPLCPPGPPNVAGLHPGAVSRGSCPAGCRVGHFVPHLPTLRPQYWRRGPLLAQTAPPRLRAGSCGSALQGRPRWPAAAAAGAPRPRPPRPRQPQQEACGRALVRSFARKSLAPRSAPVPTLSLLPAPRAQRPPRAQVGKPRPLGAARQRRAVSAGLALGGALSSQRPAEGPGPLVVCTLEGLLSRRGWRRRRALSRSRV